jgi:hypothetical protein
MSSVTLACRYLAQTDADLQAAHSRSGPVDRLL